uniref:hypothetical protein n=1 Tax=Fusobacterium mortiferum TaxID=850 RepID=UPI003FEF0FD4
KEDILNPRITARSGETQDYPVEIRLGLEALFHNLTDKGMTITNRNKEYVVGKGDESLIPSEPFTRSIKVRNLTGCDQPEIKIEYGAKIGDIIEENGILGNPRIFIKAGDSIEDTEVPDNLGRSISIERNQSITDENRY